MNKEILQKALAMIEASETFTMRTAFVDGDDDDAPCKTPGCIAGHIIAAGTPPGVGRLGDIARLKLAASIADIREHEAADLFLPYAPGSYRYYSKPGEPGYITREHAAACLREFIDTGIVRWVRTRPKEAKQ